MRTITLQDKASSPSTELRAVVEEEEGGVERWREFRAPKLPPRRTQGALTVAEQDPLVDFTWSQDDWSGGALRPYYRDGDARYALSKAVDARWEGVLSLGMNQSAPMDFLVMGMHAERDADVSKWTTTSSATNPTLSRQTSVVQQGSYSYQFTVATVNTQDSWVYQDLANPTLFRGRVVDVSVWIKTATLGSSFAPNIYIDDGQTTATGGTAITASDTDWTLVSAVKTIHGSADRVRIMIGDDDAASGATTCTFYFDSINIQVEGGGTTDLEPVGGMATFSGDVYIAQGRVVAKWAENNDVWEAQYIHASADATDIIHFDNKLWVAFGYSTAYIYGSGTSWTASTLSGAIAYAKHFAVARNNAGNLGLWKTETANTIKSATDPSNSGSWSSAYTIGSSDRAITGLFSAFDTILVGKEDGLWQYNRHYANTSTAENAFAPISTEWDKGVASTNFNIGTEWHGFFYTNAASQSFIRWAPGQVQDLTSLIMQPRIPGYGGEVKAMVASPHDLWVAADIPITAEAGVFDDFPLDMVTSTKSIKIMSLRQNAQGAFNLHTIDEATFGEIDDLHVYSDASSTSTRQRYVVAAGRVFDSAGDDIFRTYRWQLPIRSPAPFIDAETIVAKTGEFDTSIWHGGVPGTSKAFLKAVFWVDNIDASGTEPNRKITVKYGLDGGDSETYTLGVLNSADSVQTLYFNDATVTTGGAAINPMTQAVGRTIQLRFSFSTDTEVAGSDPPRMNAFEIHSTLRPPKLRTWEVFLRIGEDILQESGYYDPVSKTKQLTDLDTLEDQVYPIYLKHTYDGHAGFDEESSISVQIVDRERVSIGDEYEIHRLILQEADTSA